MTFDRIRNTLRKPFTVSLTPDDTLVLKALAIMAVVAHNFFHNVNPAPGENELMFHRDAFGLVLSRIAEMPLDFLHPLAAFFGHYGVHIFLFLSGYGLTKKYLKNPASVPPLSELYRGMARQIFKLVRLTVIGVLVFCVFFRLRDGSFPDAAYFVKYLKFLTFTENVMPDRLYCFVTVWWFLSLIVQFYLLYPLLLTLLRRSVTGFAVFCAVCMAASAWLFEPLFDADIFVYATPLGQMTVFGLGMYLARGETVRTWVVALAVLLLPFTWVTKPLFHLSFFCVTIAALAAYRPLQHRLRGNRFLLRIGALSMYIYIIHGELRWDLLEIVNRQENMYFAYVVFAGWAAEVFGIAVLCDAVVKRYNFLWMRK